MGLCWIRRSVQEPDSGKELIGDGQVDADKPGSLNPQGLKDFGLGSNRGDVVELVK